MLLTRDQLAQAQAEGLPVRVRNPHTSTVVMRPNPVKDENVLQWEGVTPDGIVDSVLVDPDFLRLPQMSAAFANGLLEPVMDEDPWAAMSEGRMTPFVDPLVGAREMAANVRRSSANTKAVMRTCIMPEKGTVCGAPAPLASGANPDEVAPLCTGHANAAGQFRAAPTGRLLGNGSQEIGWFRK